MSEPVLFAQTMEAVERALGPLLTEAEKDRFAALGVDVRRALDPAYPLPVWLAVNAHAASLVAPGQPSDVQQETLGRRFIDGYDQTLLGSAMLALLKVVGPRRTLERMTRNFRSGNNYTETRLEAVGPTEYRLHFNLVHQPTFYRGMLAEALRRTGARDLTVDVVSHAADGAAVFRVAWEG